MSRRSFRACGRYAAKLVAVIVLAWLIHPFLRLGVYVLGDPAFFPTDVGAGVRRILLDPSWLVLTFLQSPLAPVDVMGLNWFTVTNFYLHAFALPASLLLSALIVKRLSIPVQPRAG